MNNYNLTRKETIKQAGKELAKGIGNSFACLKEAIVRPKAPEVGFSYRSYMAEKIPEIDWFTENKWEDFEGVNVDTRAYALQENFRIDEAKMYWGHSAAGSAQEKTDAATIYSKTYTSFSGCDMVAVVNGEVFGELQTIRKNVNGDLKGYIDIVAIKFDRSIILPEQTLIVSTYLNEYGQSAYEVLVLDKLLQYKSEDGVDLVSSSEAFRYTGKILQPLTPTPMELRKMSNEDFKAMVGRVHKDCPEELRTALPAEPKTVNSAAIRTYYWVLEHHYMNEGNK